MSVQEKKKLGKEANAKSDIVNMISGNDEIGPFDIVFKFEILGSTLTLPLESSKGSLIQLDLPYVFGNFIPKTHLVDAFKNVLLKDRPSTFSTIDELDFITVFGHDISCKYFVNCGKELFDVIQHTRITKIILMEKSDANLWITIPIPSKTNQLVDQQALATDIVVKAETLNFVIQDENFLLGLKAFMDVLHQFSAPGTESECFKCDALQFMQLERIFPDQCHTDIPPRIKKSSSNIKLSVDSVSVKMGCLSVSDTPSKPIAEAGMQLVFAASLEDDVLVGLDFVISRLVLQSFSGSVLLSSAFEDSISHNIQINLSKSNGEINILFSLIFVEVYLHLADWDKLINLLRNCMSVPNAGSLQSQPKLESHGYQTLLPNVDAALTLKSENVSVSFHLPLGFEDDLVARSKETELKQNKHFMYEENVVHSQCKYSSYLKFTFKSEDIELIFKNEEIKLRSNIKKVKFMLEIMEKCRVRSLPFILISKVQAAAELHKTKQQSVQITSELEVDSIDIGLSYDLLKFCRGHHFNTSKGAFSEVPPYKFSVSINLQRGSILFSDSKGNFSRPILEILVNHTLVKANKVERVMKVSAVCKLMVNYNNIDKVMWEPFIEPWGFRLKLVMEYGNILQSFSGISNITLKSRDWLNFNITEPLIEVISRVVGVLCGVGETAKECEFHDSWTISHLPSSYDLYTKRHAPYIICNETSLPLSFWISHGTSEAKCFEKAERNHLQPGSSVPVYVEERMDNKSFVRKASLSSENLFSAGRKIDVTHHMISIQIDGTSMPSKPMSMDLVGVRCFEVNFSDSRGPDRAQADGVEHDQTINNDKEKWTRTDPVSGLIVPVVFDVSMHCYSKLIRLYSMVVLFNASSMPLELRFDIPFGLSPKILDPIPPLHEFPLPVHLAEAGRMRWRPVGPDYLWSDAYSLSSLLSKENKSGILRSFVCYPSCPTSYPFRCCISVEDYSLQPGSLSRKRLFHHPSERGIVKDNDQGPDNQDSEHKWLIRKIKLTTPLLIKNCLPSAISLTIETSGISHHLILPEDDCASFFHIDSTHDLNVVLHVKDFMPTKLKFSRAEVFMISAKLSAFKFSLFETLAVYPNITDGPLFITVEMTLNVLSGARELNISVPFLLYNCTGIPLVIVTDDPEKKRNTCILPANYDLTAQEAIYEENVTSILSTGSELLATSQNTDNAPDFFSKDCTFSSKKIPGKNARVLSRRHLLYSSSPVCYASCSKAQGYEASPCSMTELGTTSSYSYLSNGVDVEGKINLKENDVKRNINACMYSPSSDLSATELLVRLRTYSPQTWSDNNNTWSSSFSLVPASGSTNVDVPCTSSSGAFLLSVTSTPIEALSGKTRSIIFQPRYVICNACSKALCYKQKGTNLFHRLGVRQHAHLHWTDNARELLISIRFDESGWQWSGGFLPDKLGDSQVKLRNFATGALGMVRVEVQNAELLASDEETVRDSNGTTSTLLILLSDDDTGFMPYRLDNFSMERLRIYQLKCEMFETVVHSYTSCQYAWDEPCYPHQLVLEVPGECMLGIYSLDDVTDYAPIVLPQTLEKPERRFFVNVHAEGAIKVLSIIDSSYHSLKDIQETSFLNTRGKRKIEEKQVELTERMTIKLSFIGFSLINSFAQELIFACAKDVSIDLLQNLNQQKVSFHIKTLQIDNQMRSTVYPVILSIDRESKDNLLCHSKNEARQSIMVENVKSDIYDSTSESSLYLAASKWRIKEVSLVSFEYIVIRISPLLVEVEEQTVLHLLDFTRTVSSRLCNRAMQIVNSEPQISNCCTGVLCNTTFNLKENRWKNAQFFLSKDLSYLKTHKKHLSLPYVVPIGASWIQIFLIARKKKKIYVEVFELAPLKLTLSFSSTPWMVRKEDNTKAESLFRLSGIKFQRSLMALADIEGVPIHLGELILSNLMASSTSVQQILIRHYTNQLYHEIYKIFGSAGVIGNPVGFIRNFRFGIKDFLSVPVKGIVQSPSEVIAGLAHGSKSLLSNTVYAVSSATTQFSKAAHKSIVAFTYDEQEIARIDEQQNGLESHGRGVLNEFLKGLTGLLQYPIRGAEEHGLPGVLSGIALGTAGLVARPLGSVLEATGKTAQSIRNRSNPHHFERHRVRLPRPLAKDLPLLPYSWEEAIGVSIILEADNTRLKDETLVLCKSLKQSGRFFVVTERIVLVAASSKLVGFDSPDFVGVTDPQWVIDMGMGLESVIHIDRLEVSVNIVGSNTKILTSQKRSPLRTKKWDRPTSLLLSHISVEFLSEDEADEALHVLRATIERGEINRWGKHVLHRSNLPCRV